MLNDKVLNQAVKSFRKDLSHEEIESAKAIALWKTEQKHTYGKFTTLLYNYARWECLAMLREHKKALLRPIKKVQDSPLIEYTEHLTQIEQDVVESQIN